MSPPCPACQHQDFQELIDFDSLPVSGVFLSDPADPVTMRRLRFEFCDRCALIRQQPLPSQTADYTHVSRATARQLPSYAADIIARLSESIAPTHDLIVEVGANDGTFLNALARAGFVRRLGVEPSHALSTICIQSGHPIYATHLDEQSAKSIRAQHGAAAAVLCRHTLEHVADPVALLRAMALLLADGASLFLEVPDAAPVVHELRGFELWDEHLFYFSMANLHLLLDAGGFMVEHMQVVNHRNSQNIICWARKCLAAKIVARSATSAELLASCRRFRGDWNNYRAWVQTQALSWPDPVIAMGASHPQSNYLTFAGVGHRVAGLIDEDLEKIGKWVALPRATPVFHPRELDAHLPSGTLLLTGFGYEAWTQSMQRRFAGRPVTLFAPFKESMLSSTRPDRHGRNLQPESRI